MDDLLSDATQRLVERFTQMVRTLTQQASQINSPAQVRLLESSLRTRGRELLRDLLGQLLQTAIDQHQEQLRLCPACPHQRRRHQGVRSRKLESSLGQVTLRGIYWACPCCASRQHSAELVDDQQITHLFKDMLVLAGVASTSFDKAQILSRELLGVDADDEAIRQLCLHEGRRAEAPSCPAVPPEAPESPVPPGGQLVGSCDGTMVNTREDGWRELKALRFEQVPHAEESREVQATAAPAQITNEISLSPRSASQARVRYAGAYLENAQAFAPRLKQAAEHLGQHQAGRCVFVSDAAEWITHAVRDQLPGFVHVADYFHACQHVHQAAEAVYGQGNWRARQWSACLSRRLREQGAHRLSDKLRRLALFYADLGHQRAVLDLCKYLDKHAARMDYPGFAARNIPIDSGAMESFCKQLGLRLKGPGMRWSTRNLTAMARLVSRWAVDPQHAFSNSHAAA